MLIISLILIIPLSVIFSILFYYISPKSDVNNIEDRMFCCIFGTFAGLCVSLGLPILLPAFLLSVLIYFILGFLIPKIESKSSKINKILQIIKEKNE